MHDTYNHDEARDALKRIYAKERLNVPDGRKRLETLEATDFVVKTFKYPPSTRLMVTEGEEELELVTNLQGVLCAKSLPPLTRKPLLPTLSHLKGLRQHVKITSLGLPEFDQAWEKVLDVCEVIKAYVPGDQLALPEFIPYEGDRAFESHARYFTDRKLAPLHKNEPFMRGVDPRGILRSVQPDRLIHGPDNKVEYCRRIETDGGETIYSRYDPGLFRVGDIVDMAFSFIAVPVREGGHKVLLNLRALTLIDDSVRKASDLAEARSQEVYECVIKRRPLYLVDEDPHTSKKRRIDDANTGERSSSNEQRGERYNEGEYEPGTIPGFCGFEDGFEDYFEVDACEASEGGELEEGQIRDVKMESCAPEPNADTGKVAA